MIGDDWRAREDWALLSDIFRAALRSVDPYSAVAARIDEIHSAYEEGRFSNLHVAAFGKAAFGMVRAVSHGLGDILTGGIAITKDGHRGEGPVDSRVHLHEGGHPIPDARGVRATRGIMRLAQGLDGRSLLVCLISGGGSALLVAPQQPLHLSDKQRTTELLLRAGADIHELNTVRKHISAVKGGKLAATAFPAAVLSLILSDVIDDKLDVIASGPTVPDSTTYSESLEVLDKYALRMLVPPAVLDLLTSGAEGRSPETAKAGDPIFQRVDNRIIGNNGQALVAARNRCRELGLEAEITGTGVQGEACEVGRSLAERARKARDRLRPGTKGLCLISGGETTVTVKGRGTGGRNMELALAFALQAEGEKGMTLLSAGTDGTDGPTDAAGAVVDGNTAARARAAGIDPARHLVNNDSYSLFRDLGDLFRTGPTGTNVMDIQIVLLRA